MSEKQTLLKAAQQLPETANWKQITDAMIELLANAHQQSALARLYREQITAAQLAEYVNPHCDVSLEAVLAEFATQTQAREST